MAASGASEPFVTFSRIRKTYDGESYVIRDLNLEIAEGEFLSLLGPSGSGKTTTLMLLAGFESPSGGTITLNGRTLNELPPHKRDIGMVFQNYALFPHMTVAENIAFPLSVRGVAKAEQRERVARALCVFVRQAVEHPESSRLMLRLFHGASIPDAPMNAGVRADIQEGLAAGRFSGIGLEAAILLAVGAVQIAVARAIEREATNTDALASDLALGLLRGLGVADAPAVATRAAVGVFKGKLA